MDAIFERRSVRSFTEKNVEEEKIEKLLRAAMQAPSAMNQQPWEFIVVKGKEKLQTLSEYNPYAGCLKNADVGIIVLGNEKRMISAGHWEQDLGAATQNILLMATQLGLGAVWLGTAPNEDRMEHIRRLYGLGKEVLPYSVIAIGYPSDKHANKFVDRFNLDRVRVVE